MRLLDDKEVQNISGGTFTEMLTTLYNQADLSANQKRILYGTAGLGLAMTALTSSTRNEWIGNTIISAGATVLAFTGMLMYNQLPQQ